MATYDEQDELLSAYLDGELPDEERRTVEARLASDPEARKLLDELRQTAAAVRGLPRRSAPAGLANAVRARLERGALVSESRPAPVESKSPLIWGRRFAYAAVLFMTAGVGYI